MLPTFVGSFVVVCLMLLVSGLAAVLVRSVPEDDFVVLADGRQVRVRRRRAGGDGGGAGGGSGSGGDGGGCGGGGGDGGGCG